MSMDILFIEAVVRELRESVRGAAVGKIHQTGPHDFLFRLWTGRETLRLFVSAAPRASRLYLTVKGLPNPATPPRFCQLLRSRLARLLEIERLAGERIVRLLFGGEGGSRWTLVAELLGPRANLILLDDQDRILDALHRVEVEGRAVLPGLTYRPPARPGRFDLTQCVPSVPSDTPLRPWFLENLTPMTPLAAADLEAAAVAGGGAPEEALQRFRRHWLEGDFRPCIAVFEGKRILAAYPPENLSCVSPQLFESPSAAADAFYGEEAGEEAFGGGRGELERVVRQGIKRLEKRLRNIETEQEKARNFERQREMGDLLLANLHRLRRGMAQVVLEDWFADPPAEVGIPLDPTLSPQENAESYFKRHRKGKRGLEHTERRRFETLSEIEWLEGASLALEEAEAPAELEAVRQELAAAGMIRTRPEPGRKTRPVDPKEQVRCALSPGGFSLFWGKNNRGNDHVSRHLTGAGDLWFHAHNMPGCHMVLKKGEKAGEIPEADVLFAASIAAGYSRGRDGGKVEVMVTEGKWVKKPKGARPGLVTVERYRTVVVRPFKGVGTGK